MTCEIIEGDCLEVMRSLDSVDHIITDPPYEAEAHTQQRRVKRGGGVMEVEPLPFPPLTPELRDVLGAEFGRLAKRWVLVFCQIEASQLWRASLEIGGFVYRRTCIWVKPDGMPQYSGDRPGMGYETFVACHAEGRSKWNGGGRNGVFRFNKNDRGGKAALHPTQKPRPLMRELVQLFTDPGDTILDPFCGSGTTGVACIETGRNFVGIEINPDYCRIASERCAKAERQPDLFVKPPKPEQLDMI